MSPWHEVGRRLETAAPAYTSTIVADGSGLLFRAEAACAQSGGLVIPWKQNGAEDSDERKPSSRLILQLPDGLFPGYVSDMTVEPERTFQLLRHPADLTSVLEKRPAGIIFSLGFVSNRPGGFVLLADPQHQAQMPEWPVEGNPDHRGLALRRVCEDILALWDAPLIAAVGDCELQSLLAGAATDALNWRSTVWGLGLPLFWLLDEVRLAWLNQPTALTIPPLYSPRGPARIPPFEWIEPWL